MNLCVFASGRGSNLQSIIDASISGYIKSKVALVISNNSDSGALKIAREFNIPFLHLSGNSSSKTLDELEKNKIDFIILAGYMKLLDLTIVKAYSNKIINIHPSLLPAYGGKGKFGLNVYKAVISAKEKKSGATLHFFVKGY